MSTQTITTAKAGIFAHISSLPGRFGIGTLGQEARHFIDQLANAGVTLWQVLPLNPIDKTGSAYQAISTFAGHTSFIDFDDFSQFTHVPSVAENETQVDFAAVAAHRANWLAQLSTWLQESDDAASLRSEAAAFFNDQRWWLDDFALFLTIKKHLADDSAWWHWPENLRQRDQIALAQVRSDLHDEINHLKYQQFAFHWQWSALRRYANSKGIQIIGDVPIYVATDSADVWVNKHLFQLTSKDAPEHVAGVPPDYFAEDGQLWGNPLYNWQAMAQNDYTWWTLRLQKAQQMFDWVRIDHFRGFADYWSVPASAETAREGEWIEGPGRTLFDAAFNSIGDMQVIAEDLGEIDQRVVELREVLGFPGMHVLQFSFNDDPDNPHQQQNHPENGVCYLSTHDNPTTLEWLEGLDDHTRHLVTARLEVDFNTPNRDLVDYLIDYTFASPCRYAVICLQDTFALGAEATLNRPGTTEGNWVWRLDPQLDLSAALAHIGEIAQKHGR